MDQCPYVGETELVQALQRGEQQSHFWLVKDYGGKIKGWIRYRSNENLSKEDIEELVNDTFRKIIMGIDSFDPSKARFTTWMYAVAENTLRDWKRRSQARQEAFETGFQYIDDIRDKTKRDPALFHPDRQSDPDPNDVQKRPEIRLVGQALENIPEKYRIVLIEWAYLQSHAKVAKLLKRKEGTVRLQFHRGKEALKREYETLKNKMERS